MGWENAPISGTRKRDSSSLAGGHERGVSVKLPQNRQMNKNEDQRFQTDLKNAEPNFSFVSSFSLFSRDPNVWVM